MRIALTCLALLAASPAIALSCMRPDVVRHYQHIQNDDAEYLLVKGTLALTETPNFAIPSGLKQQEALTGANASGQALSASGFNVPFDRPITIRASCLASWCGDPEGLSDETHFFALKVEADQLVLDRGPCGGLVERWSKEDEERLLDCHLKGKCRLKGF